MLTPWLVDLSGFDAYALLVEAGGRRQLYTGDFRAHGRKRKTIEALAQGTRGVDVVLLEGTRIGRNDALSAAQSEQDVEAACADAFRAAGGMALVFYSAAERRPPRDALPRVETSRGAVCDRPIHGLDRGRHRS